MEPTKAFFMNDYGEGAHPLVMQRLMQTNMEHTCGYGLDAYSLRAQELIRERCGQKQAHVHMMTGGTSANIIALSAFMRPFEAATSTPTRRARWRAWGIRSSPVRPEREK